MVEAVSSLECVLRDTVVVASFVTVFDEVAEPLLVIDAVSDSVNDVDTEPEGVKRNVAVLVGLETL